jgi:NADPH-dependent glutamate synthase beta subunit-like oxidoreductase
MSDRMHPQPFDVLLRWMLDELEHSGSIFGIPRALFYVPGGGKASPTRSAKNASPLQSRIFDHTLATPIGPAAGPHTQLAQNIVCAWLSGARFIELKTVQIMDQLEIPRPCIDMEDEGYNVEWSQELRLEQSADEYIKAWALVHILHHLLGFSDPVGTVFNMSVGYNLEGIQSPPMTRFMDTLADASEPLAAIRGALRCQFPQFADLPIPSQVTDNVTLSTMHGCPPNEIERICRYLLEERGLHTTVKLNPTLLGKETVLDILHERLGFREIVIPDDVFAHDLRYEQAVALIRDLQGVAAARGLAFGVKLSNTLGMSNHRRVLPGDEMYMSGRALYPVTINLFNKLAHEFDGALPVSYSAGADALNVTTILACGARPVTVASDLLKPGGYLRLLQYLENVEREMAARGAASLDELARDRLTNLERAAAEALTNPRYQKGYHRYGLPKVESGLGLFDCITAPCVEACPAHQDVPAYVYLIARREYDRALQVILAHNPLPAVTGYVCTHLCQTRCTRNDYDEPVAIRALKRFAAECGRLGDWETGKLGNWETGKLGNWETGKLGNWETGKLGDFLSTQSTNLPTYQSTNPPTYQSTNPPTYQSTNPPTYQSTNPPTHQPTNHVAIIGSGPSGLAAACYLALNGIRVTVFEARDRPGGMLALAPAFRLPEAVVQADIERIRALGVDIRLSQPITVPPERLLEQGFDAVYVASGAQRSARLGIEGEDGRGVYPALEFLDRVSRGEDVELGRHVLVIGGGNSAMDAARTARRLTGGMVTVVYRRTLREMPATEEEIEGLLAEGVAVEELASPARILLEDGRVAALECVRNRLGEPDASGRRRPEPIPDSHFRLEADAIIVAIGQQADIAFLDGSRVSLQRDGAIAVDPETGGTSAARVYAGGDAVRGPDTIIAACADGRRAAAAICRQLGLPFDRPVIEQPRLSPEEILEVKRARARKSAQNRPAMLPPAARRGFDLIEATLDESAALDEATRCLQCSAVCEKCVEVCPNRANLSYAVPPTHWAVPRLSCRDGRLEVVGTDEFHIEQTRQILHLDDFCNECGNCATFCVHQGRPYTDKPRLFLRREEFEREADNAFHLEGQRTLCRREDGSESRLTMANDRLYFEDAWVSATFSPDFRLQSASLKQEFQGEHSLVSAAEMAVILRGVRTSLPFLP